jgi:pyruvate,water dikinase
MSKYVIPLYSSEATLARAGGKGMSLSRLARAGLPVPEGFCVATEAYRRFVADAALQPLILEALDGLRAEQLESLEAASARIAELFRAAPLSEDLEEEILAAYSAMGPVAVAVRSSATAEDLAEASFAGQQDTYLNVSGGSSVLDATRRCWASLWNARAIGYRLKRGIDQASLALAVVVQELVLASAAGVMFTANPLNGRRDQLVINAAWGLGESVVSGAVSPDTIVLDKASGRILERRVADKERMTLRARGGTREEAVPESWRRKSVLSRAESVELAALGSRVEGIYGRPMDVEWAFSEREFYLLQARPITTLPESAPSWESPVPRAVMMRMSFAEFLPDPVSPLFATLALPIAQESSLKMMGEYMGIAEAERYPFALINGYVYVGMVIDLRMMAAMIAGLLGGVVQKMLRTSDERWSSVREKYRGIVGAWKRRELAACPGPELLGAARSLFACAAEYYTVAQSGPIPAASSSELSFGRFYKAFVKRKGDPEPSAFLLGLDSLPARAERSLYDLAMLAGSNQAIAHEFARASAEELLGRLRGAEGGAKGGPWREFRERLEAHLSMYGHTAYDLDFSKPLPFDDPEPLIEAIKTYLSGKARSPYERQRAAAERREEATRAVEARLGRLRGRWFARLLGWAQDCAPKREDCIAEIGLGYPLLRGVFAEMGRRLTLSGSIGAVDDVYWLEADELEDELAAELGAQWGEGTRPSLASRIEERKADWRRARALSPPDVVPESSLLARMMRHGGRKADLLEGIGASGGRVTATARVLLDPSDFRRMGSGDVIVAVTTTPAWTPLFALASGVVVEIGGPLSHSSIVAREYGIPAVMSVAAATRRIKDGQLITVDGTAGLVILDRGEGK